MSPAFVPAENLVPGDVVRRVGCPLQVGIVFGIEGDVAIIRWRACGPFDRRNVALLQKRL